MPAVVGLTVDEAQKQVAAAGQNYRVRSARAEIIGRRPDARPPGQIVEQREPIGSPMRPYLDDVGGTYGEVVFGVVLSTGPPAEIPQLAPDLLRRELGEAQLLARRQRVSFNIGDAIPDPTTPSGIIVRQEPAPGQPMVNRQVTVWPSAGYPLPNYVDRRLEEAQREAPKLGLDLQPRSEPHLHVPRGTIFGQEPRAGTPLPLRGPVVVTVSSGWPVPDFVGRSEREADAIAGEIRAGLRKRERDNFEVPAGIVFLQEPAAGELLPPDRVISIVVSAGWPTPDFLGLEEGAAHALAREKQVGLAVSERRQDKATPAGIIIAQNPQPATLLPPGRAVTIVVSGGWATPDFVGQSEEGANAIATASRLTLVRIDPREDFDRLPGLIVAQRPAAGTAIPANRQVEISLSLGWPVAPDAVGRPATAIEEEFLASWPRARIDRRETLLTLEPAGTVVSQSPEPQVKLDRDQRLELVAAGEKPPWTWPAIGLFALAAAVTALRWPRTRVKTRGDGRSLRSEDPGGIRVRVAKDPGAQAVATSDDGQAAAAGSGEIVKVKVLVDLGEQSAGPVDDKGD